MKSNRRNFMKSLGLLTFTVPNISLSKEIEQPIRSENIEPGFTVLPYLQNLTSDSINIQILTNTNSYTWIEYGIEKIDQVYFESKHGMKVANCRFFNFHLKGLKPDTTYSYCVHTKHLIKMSGYDIKYGGEVVTENYTFKTQPVNKSSCEVIIFNDIHDRAESFGELWNVKKQTNTDLVLFNGDIFNQVYEESQVVKNFFMPISKLFSTNTPFVFNRGNHETRGAFARELVEIFNKPNKVTYQAFKHGPIFWICLDSGEDKTDGSNEYFGLADYDKLRLEQRDWLLSIVKTKAYKKAKYRAVVMHMPPLHSGDWHGPTHCTKLFVPIFNQHKIDIVYSGHTHKAKFYPPSGQNKFALFIGGAPQIGKRTIMDIKANEKSFLTQMIDDSGNILEKWEINR
ncbi:MAG: metallophosphoesterase family protein [Sphingobacterium composti]